MPALPVGILLFSLGVYEYGKDFPVLKAENTTNARIRYAGFFIVLTVCEIWTQTTMITLPA